MPERSDEFEGIFEATGPETRPVMSMPPRVQASMKLIREVRDTLGLGDDAAVKAADWIADKMERFGARSAQPTFTINGSGPVCSWCGVIWPLCGHHHLSVMLDDEDTDDPAPSPKEERP